MYLSTSSSYDRGVDAVRETPRIRQHRPRPNFDPTPALE